MALHRKTVPNISVVLPIHNKGPHVSRAITSVLNQSHRKFELLVIDDASSDNSLTEILRFRDPRIRLFRRSEPGPGGYAARNLGIREAKTEWIAFLDADDEWTTEHLQRMAEVILGRPELNIISAGWESRYHNSRVVQRYYLQNVHKGIHTVALKSYLQNARQGSRFCATPVVVARRSALLAVGGFPEGRADKGGDLYLWVKLLAKSDGVWSPHIGAYVYHDSVNKVTLTRSFNPSLLRDLLEELYSTLSFGTRKQLRAYVKHLLVKDLVLRKVRFPRSVFNIFDYYEPITMREAFSLFVVQKTPTALFALLSRSNQGARVITQTLRGIVSANQEGH